MSCRSCGHQQCVPVLDLGLMPLVNGLLHAPDDPCERWPLRVVFCEACALLQIDDAPAPNLMFEDYPYCTGQSRTMVRHFQDVVDELVRPEQRVLEVASNDGSLLQRARRRGGNVLGVDPARNIAAHANAVGIPTIVEYFDAGLAQRIAATWGFADVIFANNVLAHAPNPNTIIEGIAIVLAPEGVASIEVPNARHLVERGTFDTIYHEHHSYFSVSSLHPLVARHGLAITGIEDTPVHGGSLRLTIAHAGDESVARRVMEQERAIGMHDVAFHRRLNEHIGRTRRAMEDTCSKFDRIAGYGAAAKAVVMLNAFDIGTDRLPWLADISPYKHDRYVPGTGQQVVTPSRLLHDPPDACVLFAWNLREEIERQLEPYRQLGGRLVVPFPEVTVV